MNWILLQKNLKSTQLANYIGIIVINDNMERCEKQGFNDINTENKGSGSYLLYRISWQPGMIYKYQYVWIQEKGHKFNFPAYQLIKAQPPYL